MKKQLFFLFAITFSSFKGFAQPGLWGLNYQGVYGYGTIFRTDTNGFGYTIVRGFSDSPGTQPNYGHLVETGNKLYGVTGAGGIKNLGVLYEFDPLTTGYKALAEFTGTLTGSNPMGQLMLASNGKLYGMCVNGGTNNCGTLFEFDITSKSLTKKIDFAGTSNGKTPYGALLQATNGKLYGLTNQGGLNNAGVLFEYDITGNTLTNLHDFISSSGQNPNGSLVQANNGLLYGLTASGGANNMGVLFEFNINTSTYTNKLDFNGTANGRQPKGSLINALNNKLYGMTQLGGTSNEGVIFEYDTGTNSYVKKHDFASATTGRYPYGSLMQAANGKFYGVTMQGGSGNIGVIFEYDGLSTTLKKFDFSTANGQYPYCDLIQAANGKLYGVTNQGGQANGGVLFEYDTIMSAFAKKINFNGSLQGAFPYGSLMQASNGKLYGLTNNGGTNNQGALFEYDALNGNYNKLFDFLSTPSGWQPMGQPVEVNNKLYGICWKGGNSNQGTLFGFDLSSNIFTKHYDFTGGNDGGSPQSSLLKASNGKLYGTALLGFSGHGVIYEFNTSTNTYTMVLNIPTANDGDQPGGNLLEASNGTIYGVTKFGGTSNKGVLFEFNKTTNNYTKLIDFTGTANGDSPIGGLCQASNGKLYGTTRYGGLNGKGTLFEYDIISNTLTKKIDFNGIGNGDMPQGALMQSSNGKLYGMTTYGGTASGSGLGVLFEYDITTGVLKKLLDMSGQTGANPQYGHLIELCLHPPATLISGQTSLCQNTTATFSVPAVPGVNSYTWALPSGWTGSSSTNTITVNCGTTSGSLTLQSANVCGASAPSMINVVVNPIPTISVTSSHSILCSGQTATVNAGGATTYSWSTGASSNSITVNPLSTTAYTVTGVTSAGCTNVAVFTQNVTICSGINNYTDEVFSLFPNPTQNIVNIETPTDEKFKIEIADVLGRTVLRDGFQKNTIVDLRGFEKGVYYAKISSKNFQKSYKIILE